MSRTTDQCTTIDADANEETNADTFASYVRASKKCPSCGRPTKLIKSKSGKFFLACAGYPACRKTLPVDIDMIEEYFYRNSKKGQHCVQCGYSLEAKAGKHGVYVQCCGAQRHKYKLTKTASIAKSLRSSPNSHDQWSWLFGFNSSVRITQSQSSISQS